jgi:hypothetical protein
MSYTYHTSANNTANANTITISPTVGDVIVVISVTTSGGGTPTMTVADGHSGVWTTTTVNGTLNGAGYYTSIAYCLSAPAGVTTLTVTFNGGTPGNCDMAATCYSGLNAPSFIGIVADNYQNAPGTGTNAIVSTSFNVGITPALFVGITTNGSGNGGATAGTGFTLRVNNATSLAISTEDVNAEVTGSQIATFTNTTHGGTDQFDTYAIAFADTPPTISIGAHTLQNFGGGLSVTTTAITTSATGSTFIVLVNSSGTYGTLSIADSYGVDRFYCQNGVGGSGHTVTLTSTVSGGTWGIAFIEILGAAVASYDQSNNYTSGTAVANPTSSGSLTLSAVPTGGQLLLSMTSMNQGVTGVTWSVGGGFTLLDNHVGSFSQLATAYQIVSSNGTYAASWNNGTGGSHYANNTIDSFFGSGGGGSGNSCLVGWLI